MKFFVVFAFPLFFFTTLTFAYFPEWAQEKYFDKKEDRDEFRRYLDMRRQSLDAEFEKYQNIAFSKESCNFVGAKKHQIVSPQQQQQQDDKARRRYLCHKLFIIANARLHKKSEDKRFTVDLHGQTPKTLPLIYSKIMKIAQEQYRKSEYSESFACVYFMTGKGNHSAVKGKCLLKETLDVLLKRDKLKVIQLGNSGIWGVRLNIPKSDDDASFDKNSLLSSSSLESSISCSSSDESAFFGGKRTLQGKFHFASDSSQNVPVCARDSNRFGSNSSSSYYHSSTDTSNDDENSLPQRKHFKSNLSSASINSVKNEISQGREHLKTLSENNHYNQSSQLNNNPWLMKDKVEQFVKKGFQLEENEFPPMNDNNSSMKRKLVEDSWEDENEMDGTFREYDQQEEDLDQTFIA